MKIQIYESLVTEPAPRDVTAPWLNPRTNKVRLYQDFVFRVIDARRNIDDVIVTPEGYYSDWSTIPRILWRFYPPNYSEARRGAVAHDYLYSHLYWYYSKEFADDLLKAFMLKDGANRFTTNVFRASVAVGGRGGWYYHRRPGADPHWTTRHERIHYDTGFSFTDEVIVKPK